MKWIVYILLAASIGLNAGLLVAEYSNRGGRKPAPVIPPNDRPPLRGPEHLIQSHVAGMTGHLNLSEAQQDEVRTILRKHVPRLQALRRESEQLNLSISKVFAAGVFESKSFSKLAARVATTRASIDSLSTEMLLSEASLLTPDQRRKYAEIAPHIHSDPRRVRPARGHDR